MTEVQNTNSAVNGYSSFCITIRPREGLKDSRLKDYITWSSKQAGAYGVCEGEGVSKHLHLQVFTSTPRHKGDVARAVERIFKRQEYDSSELKVLRQGVRIAYNDDWIDNYLQKTDDVDVVISDVPENSIDYYPTETEQEIVRARKTAVDEYFFNMSQDLTEWLERVYLCEGGDYHPTLTLVKHFIGDMMYKERKYRVIQDPRKVSQVCHSLYHYFNKNDKALLSEDELHSLPQMS